MTFLPETTIGNWSLTWNRLEGPVTEKNWNFWEPEGKNGGLDARTGKKVRSSDGSSLGKNGGSGVEASSRRRRLYISAFTIGMGYLIGGLIPLFPYFFIPHAQTALVYSCIVTGVVLLIFGAIKALQVTGASNSAYGIVWGAVSTLLVGGIAAGAAFGIVRALEGEQ
ncbi:hypothetical protein K435DRAFT_966189 [Dendrothele bispora CBS 962.96]|uniref:Uncharacterized protein n=1 Tax=Dendrothele bispora (strain CBS 962.96) TaxID=1314807 RepID=A0A4S8M1I1_DENBC|nr:hypothetical protein K435DRAFT_966189 [Dendrothele bispora CBS 962.96]